MKQIIEYQGEKYDELRFNESCGWYEAYNVEGYWTPIDSEHSALHALLMLDEKTL